MCDERFALTSTLQAHMRDNHERLHACDKCGKKFFTSADLDSHVARLHLTVNDEGEVGLEGNMVPCQKCGRLLQEYYVRQHEAKCSG